MLVRTEIAELPTRKAQKLNILMNMKQSTNSASKPQARNLIAFSALIMILFSVIVAFQASKAYEESVNKGETRAKQLSHSVADHIELTFNTVDINVRRAVERQYFNELFGGKLPKDMENNFRLWVHQTPQIAGMYMVSSNGEIEYASARDGYANLLSKPNSLRSEKFFSDVRDGSDTSVFVWSEFNEKINRNMVFLARKVVNLDSSFGGMVIAAIDPMYFLEFFKSVETGRRSYMALALNSGEIMVEGPAISSNNRELLTKMIQRDVVHSEISEVVNSGESIKIYSHRFLNNFPLLASVIIDEEDFLKDWSTDRVKDIGFLAIFAIFGSVLSFFALTMAKQIKRVEESESSAVLASQAKSEFLANMSHELRTPLNAIIGFSEMLDSGYFGNLNTKQKERVHDINLCGNHLLQLINDILEFSKGEAGKLELQEEAINIVEIVEESRRIMNEKARSNDITLEVAMDLSHSNIYADKRKLRQVILNLLSNSIKFTPRNGKITISSHLDGNRNFVLTVSDTGIGIPEEDIPKALSVFGQVHRHMSHEGTGLGLPLCRMFTELHNGKLILESRVGQGTTVKVILPGSRVL